MGFGPPPVSPLVYTARDIRESGGTVTAVLELTITVPYDDGTGEIQDAITTHRDVGCAWSAFVVYPGTVGQTEFSVSEGDGTIALSALTGVGIVTHSDLENAGYTAT